MAIDEQIETTNNIIEALISDTEDDRVNMFARLTEKEIAGMGVVLFRLSKTRTADLQEASVRCADEIRRRHGLPAMA